MVWIRMNGIGEEEIRVTRDREHKRGGGGGVD